MQSGTSPNCHRSRWFVVRNGSIGRNERRPETGQSDRSNPIAFAAGREILREFATFRPATPKGEKESNQVMKIKPDHISEWLRILAPGGLAPIVRAFAHVLVSLAVAYCLCSGRLSEGACYLLSRWAFRD